MIIRDLLHGSAQRHPEKDAVWHKDQWMSYGALDSLADRLARHLAEECGVRRGDRVALLLENSFDYVIGHFAVFKAGAVNVSLNTETTSDSLAWLLNDCGAKVLIAARKFQRHLPVSRASVPALARIILDQDPGDGAAFACPTANLPAVYEGSAAGTVSVRCIDTDLASIVYTSGSTGKPKGVMLSHLNLMSNNRSIVEYLQVTALDRILAVLPFYYIYGKSLLYTHFLVGGSVVIENRFAFPNVALDTLARTEATGFAGVPSTFMILLGKSSLRSRRFPSLRYVTQAGGALAPNIQKEVAQVFQPARLFVMYGSTEASPRLTYLEPELLESKWGSIGKAIPNVDVFIADPQGRRLPRGQVGEIAARGSNIMMGYLNDPESTAEVLRDGTYFTGDLGREDADGCIFVEGRIKDIIKAGGNRVSAKEIEEAILAMEGVLETAVIGVEDPILGEAIKALVVAKDGFAADEGAVKAHLVARLPPFKMPKWIEFRESLPKNESGKILKSVLRQAEKQAGTGP